MQWFWSLKGDDKPVHVAKATYADDFDSGLMSLLVSHKSNNLRQMNKLQSMVVRGFYNASDNAKVFAEIDPLERAVTSIGLKLRKRELMNRKFDNELTYSPDADSASAKVEFSEGKTKIALALTLAKFTKSGFGSHKETIDIKRSVRKDTKLSAKYDLQKQTVATKIQYSKNGYNMEAAATAAKSKLSKMMAKIDKTLSGGNVIGLTLIPGPKLGAIEYKNKADTLPFSLSADFPLDAHKKDLISNSTVTFKTRINVLNN